MLKMKLDMKIDLYILKRFKDIFYCFSTHPIIKKQLKKNFKIESHLLFPKIDNIKRKNKNAKLLNFLV